MADCITNYERQAAEGMAKSISLRVTKHLMSEGGLSSVERPIFEAIIGYLRFNRVKMEHVPGIGNRDNSPLIKGG